MTVLVTGSTGTVGSEVTKLLVERGATVRALSRDPAKSSFPDGVQPVAGEMTDPDAMRAALDGVSGLFLLSAVTPDELNATLTTLGLALEAGVRDVVYLSVIHADRFTDVPHFAAKAAVERALDESDVAATIMRPGYYMQNDLGERERLEKGTYAVPLGNKGVLASDVRDLAEVGALSLLNRQAAGAALPRETIDVVSPERLTGDGIAAIWSERLDREVTYGGDDLDAFERTMAQFAPGWMAYDMRTMFGRFQSDGMVEADGDDEKLQKLLGRPMRSYRDLVGEAVASW